MKWKAGALLPWTVPPYGYRSAPDRPRDPSGVQIEPVEGAIVREWFARYLEDKGTLLSLAKHLLQLRLPSPRGNQRWSAASIRGLLLNPVYTGKLYIGRNGSSEKNRVQKILEDANVKLGNVLADVFGVSGQLMLEALLKGKAGPEEIAQLAQRRARKRIPEIVAALEEHQMSAHHRQMIRYSVEHMQFIEQQIIQLDQDIAQKIRESGLEIPWQLLQSVPGVQAISAATILAETGTEMQQFGDEKHFSSWAESARATIAVRGRTKVVTRREVTRGCEVR